MLSLIISLLGSSGFGTIFGGIMGLLNRKTDLQAKGLELQHDLAMKEMDAKIMAQEWASRTQVAVVEAGATVEAAGYAAMAKSYDAFKPAAGGKIEAFSAFIRPFVSMCYFLVSSIGAFLLIRNGWQNGAFINTDQVDFTVHWIAFMSSATIGWWFAMRPGNFSKPS